jgi:hypothetical protein
MQQETQIEVKQEPAPVKKRCAFANNGVHYFYPKHGEILCCERCRKLDDRPPR